MAFNADSIDEIIAQIKTDLASIQITTTANLQAYINVSDKNSKTFADITALAGVSHDIQKDIELKVVPNSFIKTTKTLDDLNKHAEAYNMSQNPATGSNGFITLAGTVGGSIPLGTTLTSSSITYQTKSTVAIGANSLSVTSLTRTVSTVTAQTVSNHNFGSGQSVIISGANETDYNGTFVITVTSGDEFTYTVTTTPSTPATGTILANSDMASVEVDSIETGINTNLSTGDTLQLVNGIAGVNNTAFVQFGGVQGGTDIESFDDYKTRVAERKANPITRYNEANVISTAKTVAGVTKVWVRPETPATGQATVYFIRGNDENIIPSASERTDVKNALIVLLGVDDSANDLLVPELTAVSTAFTFSALSPDTVTMRTAVTNNLEQFFTDETVEGQDVTELQYNNAIGRTFDLETGESISSYTLSTPSGDISISSGELATLGAVTYP